MKKIKIDTDDLIFTEFDFQDFLALKLKKGGHETSTELIIPNLEGTGSKRIDLFFESQDEQFFVELKDFRKNSIDQINRLLGELFLQVKEYDVLLNYYDDDCYTFKRKEIKHVCVSILFPVNVGYGDFKGIFKMFTAHQIKTLRFDSKELRIIP